MCCGCVQPGLGMDREYLINGIDDMEVQVNELWKYPAQLHSGIDDKEVLVNELWKCPAQGWHGMDDREVQVNELWIHPAQLRDEPRVT